MGRRGPKPQPAGVREQKAPVRSRQRKAVEAAQPAASAGKSDAPAWLKGEGLKIFQKMAPALRSMKLLTETDAPAFARYCKHYARWLEMQKRLDNDGEFYEIETASGKVRRADPAFTMADRLDRMMLAFEDRFGLNPAERQRIMMQRSQATSPGLFGNDPGSEKPAPRDDDPTAAAAPAAEPVEGPIGLLN